MEWKTRARVLCVDDEPNVLEGLALHLRRYHEVSTATSGAAGLEILAGSTPVIVVISDMRMPSMDGATFLTRAREIAPDAVRILLTGHADLDSAIAAINDGHIFRFLTKPCPPPTLLAAVAAAVEQHRLITAERDLLERTLHGSIKMLTDILSLTNPFVFGRATRIKNLVAELAATLGLQERWQVEVAAMVSQLGWIALPPETIDKVYYGHPVTQAEQGMIDRVPTVTERLLANIPRLDAVREMLVQHATARTEQPADGSDAQERLIERGANILRVAIDFDTLAGRGDSDALSLDTLRGRAQLYDAQVLDALATVCGKAGRHSQVRELPASALRVGMIVAEDVKLKTGALLVPRGQEVTTGFVERVRNFSPGMVNEPVRVFAVRSSK
jgi:response regulator RpfG family c-di-GMP phosphodiesterase